MNFSTLFIAGIYVFSALMLFAFLVLFFVNIKPFFRYISRSYSIFFASFIVMWIVFLLWLFFIFTTKNEVLFDDKDISSRLDY